MVARTPSVSRQNRWLCSASYLASASTVSSPSTATAWRIAGVNSGESCVGPRPVTAPTIRCEWTWTTAVSFGQARRRNRGRFGSPRRTR
jgi:hypothetical protein